MPSETRRARSGEIIVNTIHTPWGRVDHKVNIARGIIMVGTPSHGGIHLSPTLNARVHPAWREQDGWYEEDCDWAIVALTFPAEFEAHWAAHGRAGTVVEAARGCAIRWHEAQYREVFPDRAEPDLD